MAEARMTFCINILNMGSTLRSPVMPTPGIFAYFTPIHPEEPGSSRLSEDHFVDQITSLGPCLDMVHFRSYSPDVNYRNDNVAGAWIDQSVKGIKRRPFLKIKSRVNPHCSLSIHSIKKQHKPMKKQKPHSTAFNRRIICLCTLYKLILGKVSCEVPLNNYNPK